MATRRFENIDPDKRSALLNAARGEFIKNGFEGASLNRILTTAGLSKGSFYYYFEDKADLYATVVVEATAPFYEQISEICNVDTPEEYWRELEVFTRETSKTLLSDPELLKLWLGIMNSMGSPSVTRALGDLIELSRSKITVLVARGRQAGAITTAIPDDLIADLLNSIGETLDLWSFRTFDSVSEYDIEWHVGLFMSVFRHIATISIPSPFGRHI